MIRCFLLLLAVAMLAAGSGKSKTAKHKRQASKCADTDFQCANGQCVQEEWTCDSDNDCGDNSDETLPQCPPPGECSGPHEVLCDNKQCVPVEFRCDGDDDCGDGTDERDCNQFECPAGEWKCGNGLCVETDWLCDGDNDCGDGTDELSKNCGNSGAGN